MMAIFVGCTTPRSRGSFNAGYSTAERSIWPFVSRLHRTSMHLAWSQAKRFAFGFMAFDVAIVASHSPISRRSFHKWSLSCSMAAFASHLMLIQISWFPRTMSTRNCEHFLWFPSSYVNVQPHYWFNAVSESYWPSARCTQNTSTHAYWTWLITSSIFHDQWILL